MQESSKSRQNVASGGKGSKGSGEKESKSQPLGLTDMNGHCFFVFFINIRC